MAETNASGFSMLDNTTVVADRTDVGSNDSTVFVILAIWCTILVLGVPGNILSAIVWFRRGLGGNNSSAVYLAALAINDLVFLLFAGVSSFICREGNWFCQCFSYLVKSAFALDPLLVLGFSVERLVAIFRPLQVGLRFI